MRKALKAIIYSCAAVLVVMFFLSLLGIIDNNGGNAFGFFYKAEYVSFLLTLGMILIAVTDGRFTWLGELSLICLDAYMLWLHGKTGFLCLFVLTFVILWRHYRHNGGVPFQDKKSYGFISFLFFVIYLPVRTADLIAKKLKLIRFKQALKRLMVLSVPICFALNCLLVFTYLPLKSFWESVPVLGTFKDRLKFGLMGFQEFPVRLFGNDIYYSEVLRTEKTGSFYFFIDSTYIKILLEYGIVVFVLVFGLIIALQVFLYKKNRMIGVMLLSVMAVECLMEYQPANYLLLILFVAVINIFCAPQSLSVCDRLSFKSMSSLCRWTAGIFTIAFALIMSVWCFTAYQITGWRGWTPLYGATVAVPGDYMYLGDDIIFETGDYLLTHPDAACIVSGESERTRLMDIGVDESRIFIVESDNIDDLLVSSCDLISSENLPNRLTVCAYSMQHERISRHAAALHIPVNSISVKPESHYLSLFTGEQWRLLCGD